VAGIANVEALKNSPLHVVFEKLITSKKGEYFSKMPPSWLAWGASAKII
jgi:hypothetical protein